MCVLCVVCVCVCDCVCLCDKMVILSAELNTGIVLWFQQFYGLLIKRFLHSLRNWRAIITQLIMPVLFIALGLSLVYSVPGTSSLDPKRSLSLRSSAIDDEDIRIFHAEFGNGNPIFQVRQIYSTVIDICM